MAKAGDQAPERRASKRQGAVRAIVRRIATRATARWILIGSLAILLGVFVVFIEISPQRATYTPMQWLGIAAFLAPIFGALVALLWYGRVLGRALAERVRAEAAVRASEEGFRIVASTIGDGIITIDDHSRIQFVNQAVERIFGYTREELLGNELTMLMPDDLRPRHHAGFQRYLSSGRRSLPWESIPFHGRHKDGHVVPLEISIGEHTAGGRRVFTGIVRDVSERIARSVVERRLAAIVESSEDAILSKDLEGTILTWNTAAERMYGYTADEVVGQSVSMLVPPDKLPEFRGIMDRLRRGEELEPIETFRVRKDGERFAASIRISPIRDDTGRTVGASTITRDITEEKRAAEALRAREAQLRSMIEGAPNGLVMVDGKGRITTINSQVEQLFGYRRDDLMGQPIEVLLPDRYRAGHPDLREGFWASPQARPMGKGRDLFARRKDGSEFPVEIGLNPIETPEGRFVLASVVDITDRKKAEVESSRIAQELTNLIDTANAPIFGIDRDGRVTEWNRTAAAITGYEKKETLGHRLVEEFITREYQTQVKEVLDKALKGNETANYEFPLYTRNGDRRDVLLNATTRRDVQGNIIGVIGVGQDITDRKRAEQALAGSEAKF
ncbi:MAG TPA: PAS domain S-box protein, partial [Thermoplasmata archaeon]|nr:PAS domain S-box protein [Thermoplasmata archaeon]